MLYTTTNLYDKGDHVYYNVTAAKVNYNLNGIKIRMDNLFEGIKVLGQLITSNRSVIIFYSEFSTLQRRVQTNTWMKIGDQYRRHLSRSSQLPFQTFCWISCRRSSIKYRATILWRICRREDPKTTTAALCDIIMISECILYNNKRETYFRSMWWKLFNAFPFKCNLFS